MEGEVALCGCGYVYVYVIVCVTTRKRLVHLCVVHIHKILIKSAYSY